MVHLLVWRIYEKKGIMGLRRALIEGRQVLNYDRDEDYYSGGGDTHDDFDDVGGFPGLWIEI